MLYQLHPEYKGDDIETICENCTDEGSEGGLCMKILDKTRNECYIVTSDFNDIKQVAYSPYFVEY